MNKFLASSADPTKLSLTIKGILVGLIPIAIFFAGIAGVDLAQGELNELIESIGVMLATILGAVSAMMTVYGLVRKILLKFKKK